MTSESVDIGVIGAGPAGLMAAAMAAQSGANVLLMDKQSWAGGRLGLQTQPLQGPKSIYRGCNGIDFCKNLLNEAISSGVEVTLGVEVSQVETVVSGFALALSASGEKSTNLKAKALIFATGSWEPSYDFPGSNLQGVMLSGEAQARLNVHDDLSGSRVLMVGSDNAGLLIAANLRDAGAEVVAVADESPRVLGREFNAAPLRDTGVELLTSSKIVSAQGKGSVESATVLHESGQEHHFDVDTICLAGPRVPEIGLLTRMKTPMQDVEALGGPVPVHNRSMAAVTQGLYVCGDASGVENGAVALESGRLAGVRAAMYLGYEHPLADVMQNMARGKLGHLRRGRNGSLKREAKIELANQYRKLTRK